jgi:hypothetical protein
VPRKRPRKRVAAARPRPAVPSIGHRLRKRRHCGVVPTGPGIGSAPAYRGKEFFKWLGALNIVGRPMARLLLQELRTVSIAHVRTIDRSRPAMQGGGHPRRRNRRRVFGTW